jgi:hypothetical protein
MVICTLVVILSAQFVPLDRPPASRREVAIWNPSEAQALGYTLPPPPPLPSCAISGGGSAALAGGYDDNGVFWFFEVAEWYEEASLNSDINHLAQKLQAPGLTKHSLHAVLLDSTDHFVKVGLHSDSNPLFSIAAVGGDFGGKIGNDRNSFFIAFHWTIAVKRTEATIDN